MPMNTLKFLIVGAIRHTTILDKASISICEDIEIASNMFIKAGAHCCDFNIGLLLRYTSRLCNLDYSCLLRT